MSLHTFHGSKPTKHNVTWVRHAQGCATNMTRDFLIYVFMGWTVIELESSRIVCWPDGLLHEIKSSYESKVCTPGHWLEYLCKQFWQEQSTSKMNSKHFCANGFAFCWWLSFVLKGNRAPASVCSNKSSVPWDVWEFQQLASVKGKYDC